MPDFESVDIEQLIQIAIAADNFLQKTRVGDGQSCDVHSVVECLIPVQEVQQLWYAIESAKWEAREKS